jgi:hypothetical protein
MVNGVHHPIVDAAPAELIRERVPDILLAGIWIAVQQNLCGHDHAVGAVSALSGLLVDERLLQRMRLLDGTQSLESGDLVFADILQRNRARPCKLAADDSGAGATLPETATELGAIQSEVISQHVQQRGIGRGIHQMQFAVDSNSMRHASPVKLEAV